MKREESCFALGPVLGRVAGLEAKKMRDTCVFVCVCVCVHVFVRARGCFWISLSLSLSLSVSVCMHAR